jgi:hypothetical protein
MIDALESYPRQEVVMSDRLTRLHRALLWLLVLLGVLGVVFLTVPDWILDATGIIAPIEVNVLVRVTGAFVVAIAATAVLALRSDSWADTGLFTGFVLTAYLMVLIVRVSALAAGTAGGRWQVVIFDLVIVVGFAFESVRRIRASHPRREMPDPGRSSGGIGA